MNHTHHLKPFFFKKNIIDIFLKYHLNIFLYIYILLFSSLYFKYFKIGKWVGIKIYQIKQGMNSFTL